jgi:hypothetical protein
MIVWTASPTMTAFHTNNVLHPSHAAVAIQSSTPIPTIKDGQFAHVLMPSKAFSGGDSPAKQIAMGGVPSFAGGMVVG